MIRYLARRWAFRLSVIAVGALIAWVTGTADAALPSPRPIEETTCTTPVTVSSGTVTICSLSATLPEGRYLVLGRLRAFSMTAPSNPGIAIMTVASAECDRADMRQTVSVAYTLQCTKDHAGGTFAAALTFARNTGTTVFGVTSDPGFAQKITVALIQEPETTFPPFPTPSGPMSIDAFTGDAAAVVDLLMLVMGAGVIVVVFLLAAILVAGGLRR